MPGFNAGAQPQGQPQLSLAQLMQLRQLMPHAFGNPGQQPQQGMQPGMPPQGMQMPPGLGQAQMGMQMPQQGLGMQTNSLGARSLR